jgi:hypothetical protein
MDQNGIAGEVKMIFLYMINYHWCNNYTKYEIKYHEFFFLAFENLESNSLQGPLDTNVLSSVYQLGSLFARNPMSNMTNMFNSTQPISAADTAEFYKYMCGSGTNGNSNKSMFGFEPEGANRWRFVFIIIESIIFQITCVNS